MTSRTSGHQGVPLGWMTPGFRAGHSGSCRGSSPVPLGWSAVALVVSASPPPQKYTRYGASQSLRMGEPFVRVRAFKAWWAALATSPPSQGDCRGGHMRKQRIVKPKQPPFITATLLDRLLRCLTANWTSSSSVSRTLPTEVKAAPTTWRAHLRPSDSQWRGRSVFMPLPVDCRLPDEAP